MNDSISIVASKVLPALSGSPLTYNPEKNIYLTLGYTSEAGNTYFKAIRVSNRIAVYYEIGEGYAHTFLNGITIIGWDGHNARIIAHKTWGGYDWQVFSESYAKEQSILMVKDYLAGQSKLLGFNISEQQMLDYSERVINETMQKQLV